MRATRLSRYVANAHAEGRLGLYASWSPRALQDARDRLASYKALQEAAEALADVAAMFAVDAKHAVADDRANDKLMADRGVFPARVAEALAEFSALRNVLVHEYDGIDDPRALRSAATLTPSALEAIEGVRAWLSKSA